VDVPWLSENPISGTVAPSACQVIDVMFDSTGMMPGEYYAGLEINSNDPDEPVITLPVTMTVQESAAIVAVDVITDGCVATFTAYLAGDAPLSWVWDFGSYGMFTDVNPIAVDFMGDGTYPYLLTAWNDCGMEELSGTVDVACGGCISATIGDITYSQDECSFDFAADVYGTPPYTYLWHFGDGMTSTEAMPSYTYAAAGDYTVTLEVWNCDGAGYDMYEEMVSCAICEAPTNLGMMWSPLQPGVGVEVSFGGAADGTAPITFDWDFGDGMTGTGEMVTHTYAMTGTYEVTMWASNGCGTDMITDTITVLTETVCVPVTINDVATDIDGCVVDFTPDLGGDIPITFMWHFGDGMTDTVEMPSHDYGASGTYTVTLEAENCAGAGMDTYTFAVTVSCEPPMWSVYLPLVFKAYGP